MTPACLSKSRVRRAHRHTLTVDRRFVLSDRCLSLLFWSSVARYVVLEYDVKIDKESVDWKPEDALLYLQQNAHKKWWKDLV